MNYLASGHALNSIFGTSHNEPDKLWLVTEKGIFEYEKNAQKRTDGQECAGQRS
jgi:hypothetical protein